MSAKDGGPAFPVRWSMQDGDETLLEGMTLRDYFAGQAVLEVDGFAADGPLARLVRWLWFGSPLTDEEIAESAYATADAMLAERDR